MNLEDAVLQALEWGSNGKLGDVSILRNPSMFFNNVVDGIGGMSKEAGVLALACKESRYLGYYADAVEAESVPGLGQAAIAGSNYLQNVYSIEPGIAQGISDAIAVGIARFLGWDDPLRNRVNPTGGRASRTSTEKRETGGYTTNDAGFGAEDGVTVNVRDDENKTINLTAENAGSVPVSSDVAAPDTLAGGTATNKSTRIAAIIAVAVVLVVAGILGARLARVPQGGDNGVVVENDTVIDSGTVAEADKHEVTVSFDANGASSGTVPASITCESWTDITLPEQGDLARTGCVFTGWGESKTAKKAYAPGGAYTPDSDVVLYALWDILVLESDQFIVETNSYYDDQGDYMVNLYVTNNSENTVDINASFDFLDDSGSVVETKADSAWSVGPKDTTLITSTSEVDGVADAKYSLRASAPVLGASSAMRLLTATVVKSDGDGLEIEVKNTGDEPAWLLFCTVHGEDELGRYAQSTNAIDEAAQRIEPGDTRTISFAGNYWQYLTNDIYLYGYANKLDG